MLNLSSLLGEKLSSKYPYPPSSCDDAKTKYIGLRNDIFKKYGSKEAAAKKISAEEVKLSEAFESSLKNCGVPEATILAIRNTPENFTATDSSGNSIPRPAITPAETGGGLLDNLLNNGPAGTATPPINGNTGIVPPGTGSTGFGSGAGSDTTVSEKKKIPVWAWWAGGGLVVVIIGVVIWKKNQ